MNLPANRDGRRTARDRMYKVLHDGGEPKMLTFRCGRQWSKVTHHSLKLHFSPPHSSGTRDFS